MNRYQKIALEALAAEERGQDRLADLLYATALRSDLNDPHCITCGNDVHGIDLQCADCTNRPQR